MLMPQEMDKVLIAGQKNVLEQVIKELHKLKVLHIVEHSKSELADIGRPLEKASKLSEMIVKVRSLIAQLNIKDKEINFKLKKGFLEIYQTTRKLSEEIKINSEQLKNTEDLISKNNVLKQELKILKDIDVPINSFTPYKSLAYFTGYIKDKNMGSIKVGLSKITKNFGVLDTTGDKKCFIALFIGKEFEKDADSILKKNGFTPISFASIGNLKGTASGNLEKVNRETARLIKKKESIKNGTEKLAKDYKNFLIASDAFLSEQLEKAEAPLKFAATKDAFLIKGWVPKERLRETISKINKAGKHKILVQHENVMEKDDVPVKLDNPRHIKSFEFFMNLYSMPSYREIDPTFFVFLTFPLLFGFMLGDFGYGIVTLLLFITLKKFIPKAKPFLNILIFASLATIFFGMLFGEFFGYEEIAGHALPHILSRSHQINELLYLAIVVGVVHINLGLIIGFFNEFKSHGFMKAVYVKGAWFVLELGIVLLALSYFNLIALPIYVGIIFFLLSLAMLFKGEGVRGVVEFPSIFSNTLSYARLMAIGLSSVKLAEVINHMAHGFFEKGGFLILAGILLLVVGHTINIGIGMLGSFLHSLRLHYVEFFTKFFHGGAKKYAPFGEKQ